MSKSLFSHYLDKLLLNNLLLRIPIDCRMKFPKFLNMNDSHLKVIQCLNEIDKEKNIYILYYKFEIIIKRNDK